MQRSTSLSQTPSPPADPALPGADRLVDRAEVAALVSACQPRPIDDPARVSFESVRYKPGARLVVSVSARDEDGVAVGATLHAFRRGESEAVVDKLLASGVRERELARDADGEIVAVRFPHDHELPGLVRLTPGRGGAAYVRRLLPDLVDDATRLRSKTFRATLLRLKPGRHAVFRLDFRVRNAATREKRAESLIARVFRPEHRPFMSDVSIGGVTPVTLAHDDHRGITIESFAPGTALADEPDAAADARTWPRIASAVARFHAHGRLDGAGLDVSERVRRRLDGEASILAATPEHRVTFASAAARALDAVSTLDGARRVRTHGDLHVGQILLDGQDAWLVDIEKSVVGVAEEDLGTLVDSAMEMLLAEGMRAPSLGDATHDLIDALERGYHTGAGIRPDRRLILAFAAIAALARAGAPVRNLHPERSQMAADVVDRAERFLALASAVAEASPQRP